VHWIVSKEAFGATYFQSAAALKFPTQGLGFGNSALYISPPTSLSTYQLNANLLSEFRLTQIQPLNHHLTMSGKEGNVQREAVQGQETASGLQKEHFGTGTAAQSEAGKKGKH